MNVKCFRIDANATKFYRHMISLGVSFCKTKQELPNLGMDPNDTSDALASSALPLPPLPLPANNNPTVSVARILQEAQNLTITSNDNEPDGGCCNDPIDHGMNSKTCQGCPHVPCSIVNDEHLPNLNSDMILRQVPQNEEVDRNLRLVPIVYRKDYPIRRFSRKWRRQEVQGLCCLAVEIMCISALAALSLHALGYLEDFASETGHVPHTFSWRLLREFFAYEDIPTAERECLFYFGANKGAVEPSTQDGDLTDYATLITFEEKLTKAHRKKASSPPQYSCGYDKRSRSLEWLAVMFSTHLISIINATTAAIFLCSIAARRRKGIQVLLLLPAFLCFFMNIFQQIPTTFHYNYINLVLRDEMRSTIVHSLAPHEISPVWDETQVHMQCCGIEYPESWEARGSGTNGYPGSCCNITAFPCAGKSEIPKEQTWSVGCYQKEYEKVHSYEKWGMLLYLIKVFAEVGIFCTLSDLTRYDYPNAASVENSNCDVRDYHIKCKGILRVKGVTEDGRVVMEAKYLFPMRLHPVRTEMMAGVVMQVRSEYNQIKGSVEITKRFNVANFSSEDINIDMTQRHRGLFVFSLV